MEFESKLRIARVGGNNSDKELSQTKNISKFYKFR